MKLFDDYMSGWNTSAYFLKLRCGVGNIRLIYDQSFSVPVIEKYHHKRNKRKPLQ